jgi:GT2 family glycosyltransferase
MPLEVSVIIVNYNSGNDLRECLASIRQQSDTPSQVIVVDNNSHDDSVEKARSAFPETHFVYSSQNLGPGHGSNVGARYSTGDVLFFLNPDVSMSPGCLAGIVSALEQFAGATGPVVTVGASGSCDYGSTIDVLGHPAGLSEPGEPLFFSGAALATTRTVFELLGGFDQRFFWGAEDVDYCWRVLLSGAEVSVATGAHVYHRGGASTPGGYVRSGRIETSRMRVAMRERNTLATLVKCAPARWLPLLVPAFLVKTAGYFVGALLLGQPRLAADLATGLLWNAKHLRETLHLRRQILRTASGERRALARISRGLFSIRLIRRHGLPHVVGMGK